MKSILQIFLLVSLLVVSPVFADLAIPGEENPILAEKTFKVNNQTFKVLKEYKDNSVSLSITTTTGKTIASKPDLGEQEKLFIFAGKATSLAVKDLNGDKVPEIITAAMLGTDRSALYVFSFDAQSKKLSPMSFSYKKQNLSRDFLVADMYQQNGQDIVFVAENHIRALGKIYKPAGPIAGFYDFKLSNDDFVCVKISPVPVAKDD
jgi:hypothetical protein